MPALDLILRIKGSFEWHAQVCDIIRSFCCRLEKEFKGSKASLEAGAVTKEEIMVVRVRTAPA